ncbi:MAG: ABC transporter ATP-binding protein [Candidatus Thorarchaeota archaeon]
MGIIQLENVSVSYGSVKALDRVTFSINEGEMFSIIGPNGAGKTTALRVIAGLLKPSEGSLLFHGNPIIEENRQDLRRQAPMVFQKPTLFNTTVFKNVAYGLRIRGYAEKQVERTVLETLELVQLTELQDRLARTLSGGEQRRASLAMAIALDTELLLVDEPTAYLDNESAEIIETTLKRLNSERTTTIVMITHNFLQAEVLANRAAILQHGKISKVGTVSEIFRSELEGLMQDEYKSNTFSGIARSNGDTEQGKRLVTIELDNGVTLEALGRETGEVTIYIPPQDIIVSRDIVLSSARNSLLGKVVKIDSRESTALLTVDIGVDLMVQITHTSQTRLNISVDDEVYVTFKASSVRVF